MREDAWAYAPQYPLWSDGASKRRWALLPEGASIDASRPEAWQYPVGTRLWKEFSFSGHRVETRYLERGADGAWTFATYIWNTDESEALLAPERGLARSMEIREGVYHAIPGRLDCQACHLGGAVPVLGLDSLQLSPDRDPLAPHAESPPPGALDLPALVRRGFVRNLPARFLARAPRVPGATASERAALGYLHANCAACHNSSGPLESLGLSFEHALEARSAADEPAVFTALDRPSHFRIPGQPAVESYRLKPGDPERSAVLARMSSRHALAQMPPLGSRLVDEQAVRLIRRWISRDLGRTHTTPNKETGR